MTDQTPQHQFADALKKMESSLQNYYNAYWLPIVGRMIAEGWRPPNTETSDQVGQALAEHRPNYDYDGCGCGNEQVVGWDAWCRHLVESITVASPR